MAKSIWHLSSEAARYVQGRPPHPLAIVEKSIQYLREKYDGPLYQAVDVGCGTGISTVNLMGKFQSIVGLDASEAMIKQASERNLHGSVKFMTSSSEKMPISDGSTQLITSGRAIHYFDLPKFYREADRILSKNGVICYYSVHFPTISSAFDDAYGAKVNEVFWKYLTVHLEKYWPVNAYSGSKIDWKRRDIYVNELERPYEDMEVDESISSTRNISLIGLAKELETYSAFVEYRSAEGDERADELLLQFLDECKDPDKEEKLVAEDKFFVLMGRKP